MLESTGRSSDDGGSPRRTTSAPRAATIAPLSVHRPRRGNAYGDAGLGGALLGEVPQPGVGRDSPADDQRVDVVVLAGGDGLLGQHVAHRVLERRGDIGDVERTAHALLVLHESRDGALEPGEGEVVLVLLDVAASRERAREVVRGAVTLTGDAVDVRAAGIGQSEQPGDLVERLPRGVIDRLAEQRDVGGDVVDEQDLGVAAADQHRRHAPVEATVLELVDGDVGGEVVDAVERLVVCEGERLGGGDADQQRAGQAGAAGHGDRVDVLDAYAGLGVGLLERRDHRLEVGAAGDLGHDAAEPYVLLHARRERMREQLGAADDADTGLVARRLDPEHKGFSSPEPLCQGEGA